jgi:hypothetical protein
MEFRSGYKHIGRDGDFVAILHPAEYRKKPVWFAQAQTSQGFHFCPYRVGTEKVEAFLLNHGKTIDSLKWEVRGSKLFRDAPWYDTDGGKYEVIYFIEAMGINRIKIGITDTLYSRLYSIKTYCPYPPIIIGAIHGYRELEEEIHHKFKHLRKHGEWFEATQELRDYIAHMTRGNVVPELW